jgi:prevent-host-death family protein
MPTFVDTFGGSMITVGIRELKQQASELVRMVRETGKEVQVTYHGKVVALIVPVEQTVSENDAAWSNLDSLAARVGASWPQDLSAADAVSENRR